MNLKTKEIENKSTKSDILTKRTSNLKYNQEERNYSKS